MGITWIPGGRHIHTTFGFYQLSPVCLLNYAIQKIPINGCYITFSHNNAMWVEFAHFVSHYLVCYPNPNLGRLFHKMCELYLFSHNNSDREKTQRNLFCSKMGNIAVTNLQHLYCKTDRVCD